MIREVSFHFVGSLLLPFELPNALAADKNVDQFFIAFSFQRFRNLRRRRDRRWLDLRPPIREIDSNPTCTEDKRSDAERNPAPHSEKDGRKHIGIISPIHSRENPAVVTPETAWS